MATFGYEAIDNQGKVTKGSSDAESVEQLKDQLKTQGLILVDAKEQNLLNRDLNLEIGGYPKARDLAVFCRQFVSMTKAGVSILDALRMLTDQTENKRLQQAVDNVRANVEKGETLANSFAMHPKIFPPIMVNMTQAGEASGSLDTAMDRMSLQFEKNAKTKALVKKAFIYPTVVMVLAVVMVVVMLLVVIPKYTEMFEEMDTELPLITKMVKGASDFLKDYWFIVFPIIIGLVIMVVMWSKTDSGRHVFHKFKLNFPITKNLEVKQGSSLMARTLSTLIASGVPMVEAVEITGNVMTNVYFKEAMEYTKDEIMIGQPLSRPLEESKIFPPMVYHMVRIGEESGDTEEMLTKLADYYDEEVEMAVQSMMAALEPMIIIVLAGVVGFLIAACMAPMISMYGALGNL